MIFVGHRHRAGKLVFLLGIKYIELGFIKVKAKFGEGYFYT